MERNGEIKIIQKRADWVNSLVLVEKPDAVTQHQMRKQGRYKK